MTEGIPSHPQKKKDASDGVNLERRKFTRDMLFAAIAAAVGSTGAGEANAKQVQNSSWSSETVPVNDDFDRLLDTGKHMQYWKDQLKKFQASLRSPETQKSFQNPAEGALTERRMLRDYPPCFFDMLNEKSKLEVRRYFAERSIVLISDGKDMRGVAPARVTNKAEFVKSTRGWKYGNGIVLRKGEQFFIATNAHVIEVIDPDAAARTRAQKMPPPDVAFYAVSADALRKMGIDPAHAIDVAKPIPSRKSKLGTPIFSMPFDPDMYKNGTPRIPSGTKEWFGLRLTVTPNLNKRWGGALAGWIGAPVMVVSQGEGDEQTEKTAVGSWSYRFAQGSSGAGVASYIDGEIHFEGLLSMVTHVEPSEKGAKEGGDYQKDYSLMKCESREEVYTALNDERRIFKMPVLSS